jgi:hypothetical protein
MTRKLGKVQDIERKIRSAKTLSETLGRSKKKKKKTGILRTSVSTFQFFVSTSQTLSNPFTSVPFHTPVETLALTPLRRHFPPPPAETPLNQPPTPPTPSSPFRRRTSPLHRSSPPLAVPPRLHLPNSTAANHTSALPNQINREDFSSLIPWFDTGRYTKSKISIYFVLLIPVWVVWQEHKS